MNAQFERAIAAIDAANAQDPRSGEWDGERHPYELLYARRLTEWVSRLEPNATEALRLAARGLHIARWEIPRDRYPMTRKSYHDWRDALRELHAERLNAILVESGYDAVIIERVRELILRTTYPDDPESRVIEDAVSLLFLEMQFTELAEKTEHRKMIRILRRVWPNLTERAQEIALTLDYTEAEKALLDEALNPAG